MSDYIVHDQEYEEKKRAWADEAEVRALKTTFNPRVGQLMLAKRVSDAANVSFYSALIAASLAGAENLGAMLFLVGIVAAPGLPVVSAGTGLASIAVAAMKSDVGKPAEGDSNIVAAHKEKFRDANRQFIFNQAASTAFTTLAFCSLMGLAYNVIDSDGPLGSVPATLVSTVAGFVMGRRAYRESERAACYEAAIKSATLPARPPQNIPK